MLRVAACVVFGLLGVGIAAAATRCAPGTFDPLLASVEGYPMSGGPSPSGAFVIGADTIAMGACGSTTLRVRPRRHYTFYRALWKDCPGFGKVRYQGTTNYPLCRALVSVLRWHDQATGRRRGLKFESLRSGE